MTIHYIDPIGGNDANNGQSFANRKKTIASLSGLAAGDEVRFIATRDPLNLGSMAWTEDSRTFTLNSARSLEIDPCTDAWTASPSVTCTTNTSRKYGATASRMTVSAGFTTGKVAYKTLASTVDASGFTGVSFWLNLVVSSSFPGQAMMLHLCSDTTGDVPVASLLIDFGQSTSPTAGWIPVFIDTGSALPSNIASISLSTSVDPGSTTFQINNLIAVQGLDHPDHISHRCLIGKNTSGEPEWYPINSINGTEVTIGAYSSVQANLGPAYKGTSESVTTYLLVPDYPQWSAAQRTTPNVHGTESAPITFTFGWDRTDMSTQTGVTAWHGLYYMGDFYHTVNDWHRWDGAAVLISPNSGPWSLTTAAQFFEVAGEAIQLVGTNAWDVTDAATDACSITLDRIVWPDGAIALGSGASHHKFHCKRVTGSMQAGTNSGAVSLSTGSAVCERWNQDVRIGRIDNCMGNGVTAASGNYGFLRGCVLENNVNADIRSSSGIIYLDNCTLNSTNPVSDNPPTTAGAAVYASNVGGDSTDHRLWRAGFRAFTQSAVRQVGSGVAWEVQPTSTTLVNRVRPAVISLAKIACEANEEVTVTVYARRSNTGLTGGAVIRGGQIPGVDADVVAPITAAQDTWEELTLTFTPTARGVVEVLGYCYGGTTYSAFFDSLTVTQS